MSGNPAIVRYVVINKLNLTCAFLSPLYSSKLMSRFPFNTTRISSDPCRGRAPKIPKRCPALVCRNEFYRLFIVVGRFASNVFVLASWSHGIKLQLRQHCRLLEVQTSGQSHLLQGSSIMPEGKTRRWSIVMVVIVRYLSQRKQHIFSFIFNKAIAKRDVNQTDGRRLYSWVVKNT